MTEPYEGYAIVDLFGHTQLAGYVSQAEQYGTVMLRIDVPHADGTTSTHFHGGAALFGVHPTGEDEARRVAAMCDPAPVQRWELPALPAPAREGSLVDCEYNDEPEYDDACCDDKPCTCDDYDDQPETGPPTGEPPDFEAEAAGAACQDTACIACNRLPCNCDPPF